MPTILKRTIDRLGFLRAQIAELEFEEKALKALLVEQGPGEYHGDLYNAFVSKSMREQLDLDAARAKLGPKFVLAHTNKVPVTTVRIVARDNEE